MKRIITTNTRNIGKIYWRFLQMVFSVLGVIALFYDFQIRFSGFYDRFFWAIVICIIPFPMAVVYQLLLRRVEVPLHDGDKKLVIEFGDIFEDSSPIKVIAVNRCFDMIVDKELISPRSLHGIWLQNYLQRHTMEELATTIENELKEKRYKIIKNKRTGNKKRYPPGTIVPVMDHGTTYYLLALARLDPKTLKAGCDAQEYCKAVLKLFQYYNTYGQQQDMAVPLLGSRQARMGKIENDILKCLIALIRLGFNYGQGDIKIVLHTDLRERISLYEI